MENVLSRHGLNRNNNNNPRTTLDDIGTPLFPTCFLPTTAYESLSNDTSTDSNTSSDSDTSHTSATPITTSPTQCIDYGLKIIKINWTVTRPVMIIILKLGTKAKPLGKDFIEYLQGLPQPSIHDTQRPSTSHAQQPSTSDPQQQSISDPQQPSTSDPQQPSTSHTQQPCTSHTQQLSTSHTQQPSTSSPQQPSTSDTQQPSTSQPSTSHTHPSTSHTIRPSKMKTGDRLRPGRPCCETREQQTAPTNSRHHSLINNIQPLTPPNFKPKDLKRFDGQQKRKIRENDIKEFDITLIFHLIQLASVGVLPLHDPAWHTEGPLLENCLYMLKQHRNCAMHESPVLTKEQFVAKESELRQVLNDTLHAAQQRYAHEMATTDRDRLMVQVNKSLTIIRKEAVGLDTTANACIPAIQNEIIREITDQVKKSFGSNVLITLLDFVCDTKGTQLKLEVKQIFTKVKVHMNEENLRHKEMDHTDLLTLTETEEEEYSDMIYLPAKEMDYTYYLNLDEGGPSQQQYLFRVRTDQPQILVLEGQAGMGKTTLVKLLMKEWLEGDKGTIKGLDQYQVVLKIQCRDRHLTSFTELLEEFMPEVFHNYRTYEDYLPSIIRKSRLLIIIDGIDEMNQESRELVIDLLYKLQYSKGCTLLCTTRPEALQEFYQQVPRNTYGWSVVELVGIPPDQRPEFVRRYFEEIKRVTGTTLSGQELMDKVEREKYKEHYRIPLNLTILTWLYIYQPDKISLATTQTELYHLTHSLCIDKLDDRLAHNDKTRNIEKSEREEKVEAWMPHLYQKAFETLSRNELTLEKEVITYLRSECDKLNLPRKEVLAAFLSLKTSSIHGRTIEQYSVAHKGLHEYYGALHILSSLSKRKGSTTIWSVVETIGIRRVDLRNYLNMLKHLIGVLHIEMEQLPGELAKEAIDLLSMAGVKDENDWLDILDEVKMSPEVHIAVSKFFLCKDRIEVQDGRIAAYAAILPYIPSTQVNVEVMSDPVPLQDSLNHHSTHVVVKSNLVNHQIFLAHIPPSEVLVDISGDPTLLLPSLARHKCEVIVRRNLEAHQTLLASLPPSQHVVVDVNDDPSDDLTPLLPSLARHKCKVVVKNNPEAYQTLLASLPPSQHVVVDVSDDPTPLLPSLARHTCKVIVRGNLEAHETLLANIPPAEVEVVVDGDHSPLLPSLTKHTCTARTLLLQQLWRHPESTTTPIPFFQIMLSRDGLTVYYGQGTVGLASLSTTLTHLSVALADNAQASSLLPLLTSLKQLMVLKVHLAAAVSPEALMTRLPYVDYIFLYLSDVITGREDQVSQVISNLHPNDSRFQYHSILFPRCFLIPAYFEKLVKKLSFKRIMVKDGLLAPEPAAPGDNIVDQLTRRLLGARMGFRRKKLCMWEM